MREMQDVKEHEDEIIAGWKVQQQPFLVISFLRPVVYGLNLLFMRSNRKHEIGCPF